MVNYRVGTEIKIDILCLVVMFDQYLLTLNLFYLMKGVLKSAIKIWKSFNQLIFHSIFWWSHASYTISKTQLSLFGRENQADDHCNMLNGWIYTDLPPKLSIQKVLTNSKHHFFFLPNLSLYIYNLGFNNNLQILSSIRFTGSFHNLQRTDAKTYFKIDSVVIPTYCDVLDYSIRQSTKQRKHLIYFLVVEDSVNPPFTDLWNQNRVNKT